jgi:hypothetical protein
MPAFQALGTDLFSSPNPMGNGEFEIFFDHTQRGKQTESLAITLNFGLRISIVGFGMAR